MIGCGGSKFGFTTPWTASKIKLKAEAVTLQAACLSDEQPPLPRNLFASSSPLPNDENEYEYENTKAPPPPSFAESLVKDRFVSQSQSQTGSTIIPLAPLNHLHTNPHPAEANDNANPLFLSELELTLIQQQSQIRNLHLFSESNEGEGEGEGEADSSTTTIDEHSNSDNDNANVDSDDSLFQDCSPDLGNHHSFDKRKKK
jgi:hypothetical protein